MNTPKTLLLAVTDSQADRHAAGQGIALAASMGARVVAVSVVPQFEGGMSLLHFQDHMEEIQAPHKRALEWVTQEAAKAGVHCLARLETGTPYDVIVDVAEAHQADWIILGATRRSLLETSLATPVAERVIGYARREVLIVPNDAVVAPRRLLLCLDGSPYSQRATTRALALARSYGAAVLAAMVVDVPPEYHLYEKLMLELLDKARATIDQVRIMAEDMGVPMECYVRQGDAAATLLDLIDEAKADFLVMGSHGRTGLRRLLMGSVVNQVLQSTRAPVLVVP